MSNQDRPGPSKKVRYGDDNFEGTVLEWLDEADSSASDEESDEEFIPSDHNSESEVELSEDDEEPILTETDSNYFYGKNRFKWSKSSPVPKNTRTLKHNIVIKVPFVKSNGIYKASPEEVWNFFFDEHILNVILLSSNARLARIRQKYKNNERNADVRDIDMIELKAFLGLLILSSIFKSNHEDIRSIFATDGSGRDIFRCVMNANRFAIILACLRFDDAETRNERKKDDPLAAISEIFNVFINNCQSRYRIGSDACVDEMLIAFRGRCKFKMFMPKKPAKYGLKLMALTDARTGYLYNSYIYCGRNSDGNVLSEEENKFSKPTQAVLRLTQPISNTNRNVTADNWFSSIELVNVLKNKKLTYVGTLKKNKTEIPTEFLPNRKKAVCTSLYGYTRDMTLLSYIPKKNKAVILISSLHHNEYNDPQTGKPEIIAFYNETKGGVDSLDQKCSVYSSSRRTRRWPLAIFFRLLDIASVNSYIAHQAYRDNEKMLRFEFGKQLGMLLVSPQMYRRFDNKHIGRELRLSIKRILKLNEEYAPENHHSVKRTTCRRCPSKKERKTTHICIICKTPICLQCTERICKDCSV